MLPLVQQLASRSVPPGSSAGQRFEPNPRSGLRSILVAEPDPAVRGLLMTVLESVGYDVTEAAGSEEASQALQMMRFDVVITSSMGGYGPGYVSSRQLFRLPVSVRLLILSVDSGAAGSEPVKLGNVAFLAKPFSVPDLLRSVHRLIESGK